MDLTQRDPLARSAPLLFGVSGTDQASQISNAISYYAPTYFPPAYFLGGSTSPDSSPTPFGLTSGRDGSCYAALITLLKAIGVFDAVIFGDPASRGVAGADAHPLAVVMPKGWEETDDADPILWVRRVSFTIRIVIRVEDDASPFEWLDQLATLVQGQVDRSDLNGQCLSPLTKIRAGRYQPSSQYPEWSIDLDGEFTLLVDPSADPLVV